MIERFFRRTTIRNRLLGRFFIVVLLLVVMIPLAVINQSFLLDRLQEISDVEMRADRLLLLASARIESSRVNLMRYVQDYAPSAYEALDDVDQATGFLTEAESLMTSTEQRKAVQTVRQALDDYRQIVGNVEAARTSGEGQQVSRLLFQSYRLGNDMAQRIEQIVNDSQVRVADANEAVRAEARQRQSFLIVGYVLALAVVLGLDIMIERSISVPVTELQEATEAYRRGDLTATVPVVGTDELSLLGRAFNEMTTQLRDLIGTLEQRVARRTQDLERRAAQLATAADVGRAAASILEPEALTQRVADLICERFDLYYAALFLIDAEGRFAVLEAGTGEAGQIMKEQGHRLQVGGQSMVGSVCASRQAQIAQRPYTGQASALDVADVEPGDESVRFDNPLLPETRSEMALPLIVGERVLGALDVQSAEPEAFSAQDIAVLQLAADQVAVAIQNARLFAKVESMLATERRVYGQISRKAWQQMLQGQQTLGYYGDEEGIAPVSDSWQPLMKTALKEGRVIAGPGSVSNLAAPIKVRDQVIGVIDAHKPAGSGEWTEEEITLMETLIEQLGTALESARLYEDTQRRAAREEAIRHVTDRMRRAVDVETILQNTVTELAKAMGAPRAYVRLGTEAELESSRTAAPPNREADVAPGPPETK